MGKHEARNELIQVTRSNGDFGNVEDRCDKASIEDGLRCNLDGTGHLDEVELLIFYSPTKRRFYQAEVSVTLQEMSPVDVWDQICLATENYGLGLQLKDKRVAAAVERARKLHEEAAAALAQEIASFSPRGTTARHKA